MTEVFASANISSHERTHERFVTKGGRVTVYGVSYQSERLKEWYDSTFLKNGQYRTDCDPIIVTVTLNPDSLESARVRYPNGETEIVSSVCPNVRGLSLVDQRAALRAQRTLREGQARSSSDPFEEAILRNHLALLRRK